jgi:hypothetical protein
MTTTTMTTTAATVFNSYTSASTVRLPRTAAAMDPLLPPLPLPPLDGTAATAWPRRLCCEAAAFRELEPEPLPVPLPVPEPEGGAMAPRPRFTDTPLWLLRVCLDSPARTGDTSPTEARDAPGPSM